MGKVDCPMEKHGISFLVHSKIVLGSSRNHLIFNFLLFSSNIMAMEREGIKLIHILLGEEQGTA